MLKKYLVNSRLFKNLMKLLMGKTAYEKLKCKQENERRLREKYSTTKQILSLQSEPDTISNSSLAEKFATPGRFPTLGSAKETDLGKSLADMMGYREVQE